METLTHGFEAEPERHRSGLGSAPRENGYLIVIRSHDIVD